MSITHCRECTRPVSDQAMACPHCGAPYPAKPQWDGWGWEYRSEAGIAGLPLVHIAFKYRPDYRPVVAKGWLAIGQFATGGITIAQFSLGVLSLSQFTVAAFAVTQIGAAWSLVAQVGLYVDQGWGQVVVRLGDLLAR